MLACQGTKLIISCVVKKRSPILDLFEQEIWAQDGVWAAKHMCPGTRPRVRFRAGHQSRLDWIAFDVSHGSHQIRFIERKTGKASLPEIASPAFSKIDMPRIAPMGFRDGVRQRAFLTWYDHEMHMVGHQTVGPDLKPVPLALGAQQGRIDLAIVVPKEHGLAAVPALGDVIRNVGKANAGQPCHVVSPTTEGPIRQAIPEVFSGLVMYCVTGTACQIHSARAFA